MQMHEKVGRSRNTIFLHWFEAPEGRNVGSLKRRLRSHLARWEMRNWTPLWREEHFEVKMYKTHQVRTTFGSCDVGKSARRCGVKHISKSKCAKHTMLGPLCKLRCRKSVRHCGTKQISKSKCTKHHMFAPLLDVQVSFCVAGARDCAPSQSEQKSEGFVACPKTMAGVGHFWRGSAKMHFPWQAQYKRHLHRNWRRGRWFSARGCILEHQMCRFAEMIFRDRCSTSYDLASLFHGRPGTFDRWTAKIAKRNGTRLSALHSTFHFWRKSRRIASFWMLSSSKNEEVSQNCFVFLVVNFEKWGRLAE